ncbi:MAG: response regulator [Chthoniobacteraceae bacterium]
MSFRSILRRREPKALESPAEPPPAAGGEILQAAGSLPQSRVLLLDDREDFRDVIGEFLSSRLYHVTAVANGAEGLREIMKDTFDLIVCDMMMPQVGGEMFYWAVTRMRPAAGLRFIFITGHQSDPKIQCFFSRINATVLIKPFPLEALSAATREVAKKLC